MTNELQALARVVAGCRRCARLVAYRERVATEKRRAFREWDYWGKPVPGFGDASARLLVIGLAPAAHGGNRTGRVFTGDRSGDWLYAALHRFGFANQPTSTHRDDGLRLIGAYVTAAVHCAPPANQPTRGEFDACRPFLVRELTLLHNLRVVVALGRVAFDAYFMARGEMGMPRPKPRPQFVHGGGCDLGDVTLLASYHPSQRNTQTGFLTEPMFHSVFSTARQLVDGRRG